MIHPAREYVKRDLPFHCHKTLGVPCALGPAKKCESHNREVLIDAVGVCRGNTVPS